MKFLFDNFSSKVSKLITHSYSTSFSLGILCINNRIRNDIYNIYGFVRVADEIVDSFEGFDKKILLDKFKTETYDAIQSRISVNPILNTFQKTVHQYGIGLELIETFFESMEMDLEKIHYNSEKYNRYILGSAEVVGLMCLHVFTENKRQVYEDLKPYAMKLGSAFQKVNFLRDMKDDYAVLGRTYFPNIDILEFTLQAKKQIELEIELEFEMALTGIKMLPPSSRGGVYLAYVYYLSLFNKIKKIPAQRLLTERIRINNGKKLGLLLNSLLYSKMKWV